MPKPRNYCAVDGCTSQKINDKLSFFSLPKDEQRRKTWLEIIGRPDLLTTQTKSACHFVCSLHFDKSMIRNIPQLKADSVPTKSLPNQSNTSNDNTYKQCTMNVWTQTKESFINSLSVTDWKSFCVQTTSDDTDNDTTQTPQALSSDTPRKRKLCGEYKESEEKRKKLQYELIGKRKEVQSKESECYENFSFSYKDEVTKRFVKLLEWQSNLKNKSKRNWCNLEYKLFALNFHLSSPQTYRCLKTFLNLPSESTLHRFNMVIPPKFEDRILSFLSAKLKSMPKNAKYCTLCINEMVLKRHLHYDIKSDELIGLHNINGEVTKEIASYGCVIMLRGVVENWKQPIGYSFLASPKHYKELEPWLDEVILKLFNIGIDIQAIVSKQGSKFAKYAKEVKRITLEKPYFMFQDRKIYYIFDVPHLIQCIRNNLLSNDFIYEGKRISWKYIEELYAKQKDLRLIPKVTEKHIIPNNIQKMQVKYAAQIFSQSVFAAISVLVSNHSLPEEAKYTAKFIEQMNNIFDVLNSSKVSCPNKYQTAYSMKQYQIRVLKEAATMFENIMVIDKKTGKNKTKRIQTFKNIQITINSVMMLSRDLQEKGIHFIYTRRLNQDCMKNFFEAVRQQGGNCRDPTPIEFTRVFSKLFLRNMLQNSRTRNCQEDICELFERSDTTFLKRPKPSEYKARTPSAVSLKGETDYRFDFPAKNTLTYVSAYLLYKCSTKHNCTSFNALLQYTPNVDEITMYSHFKLYNKDSSFYGRLKVPPETFNRYIEELDEAFLNNFDNVIMYRPGSTVFEILKRVDFPLLCPCFPYDYLLKLFTRFRIFSTIKFNNREFRVGTKSIHDFIKLNR